MAAPISESVRLARALVALRQAAEAEVREVQALSPDRPLSAFEKECIRTAFKGGAAYEAKACKDDFLVKLHDRVMTLEGRVNLTNDDRPKT